MISSSSLLLLFLLLFLSSSPLLFWSKRGHGHRRGGILLAHGEVEEEEMDKGLKIPFQGPTPYIIAGSDTGLANRLRVLAAYMWIADVTYHGSHLVFVWDVNSACPAHFLELFSPLPSVTFISNSSRYLFEPRAQAVYELSAAVFAWIMTVHHVPKRRHGFPSWVEIEQRMYQQYKPHPSIQEAVQVYVREHNMCTQSAMHVRTTDLHAALVKDGKRPMSLERFEWFVKSRPSNESVYLLTDSAHTQQHFLQLFGDKKILVYSIIANSSTTEMVNKELFSLSSGSNKNASNANQSMSMQLPSDHRHTSVVHALIDVLIAAHAKEFKGSPFSSLSELVAMYSHIGKKLFGWCSS